MFETIGLGLDSLIACLAVAPLVPRLGHRLAVAAALGAADGAATYAASAGGAAIYVVVAGIALAVAWVAVRSAGVRRLCALPLLLSIDNLSVPLTPGDAIAAGVASFAMAGIGFAASVMVYRLIPARYHKYAAMLFGGAAVAAVAL